MAANNTQQIINKINKNEGVTSIIEENYYTESGQASLPEKPSSISINTNKDSLQSELHTIDTDQVKNPSPTTSIIQNKRPISDTSSQNSPNLTKTALSHTNPEKEKTKKKPKIRSRSSSSTRLNENKHDVLKPVEDFFSNNDNTPINYLQFKFILEQSTNKKINIHSFCEQVNTDIKSIMNLVEEIRPQTNDRTMKSRLTKLLNLLFQVLPPQDK